MIEELEELELIVAKMRELGVERLTWKGDTIVLGGVPYTDETDDLVDLSQGPGINVLRERLDKIRARRQERKSKIHTDIRDV